MSPHRNLRWIAPLLYQHRGAILGLLLLSLSVSGLVLLQPWLSKLLIDDGLIAKQFETIWQMASLMLVSAIGANLLGGINRYFYTRLSGRILFDLREDLFDHLQQLPPSFFARTRTGDVLSRLDGDVAEIQRFSIDSLFAATSGIFGLLGTTGFLLYISADLSLLVFLLIPVQWFYLRFMRTRVQQRVRAVREHTADLSAFLVEKVPAIKFIQSVGTGGSEQQRLHGLNHQYLTGLLRLQLTEFATQAVPNTLTAALRTTVFIVGGYRVVEGSMEVGALIAFTTYLGMAMGPVQSLLGVYMAFNRVTVNVERVQQLRDEPIAVNPVGIPAPRSLQSGIRFEQVSFGHPEQTEKVLRHVDCHFPAGSRIAISGPSGSGKSTLTDLLMRHYDPDQGRILIDDLDLRSIAPLDWRRQIALVSQDLVLFKCSLADNIRYAMPDADDATVKRAAEAAGLTSLIDRLPQGLNTLVGERGQSLSGGEKQRVAMARALLQKPLLVILDEATSALDGETENAVIDAFESAFGSITRIVISHREAVLQKADLRVRLSGGQLQTSAAG